jgi:hypothetical protein
MMTPRQHAIELLDHLSAVNVRRSNEARLHGYLTAAKRHGVQALVFKSQADILRASDAIEHRFRLTVREAVNYMDDM